ncbi:MAG TPA: hypothetical protein VFN10_12710 [Thermoanaerobaculia bacterium]|nr:hypothetical protein [Thermoanaerobaculia bacterium]
MPHRIARETPWAATTGCALLLGALLTLGGGFALYMAATHPEEKSQGIVYIVAGAFFLVGLLLLYSGIHQFFARRGVKETVFAIDSLPVRRGVPVKATILQQGPLRLESLRANLVCFEIETRLVKTRNGRSREQFTKQIAEGNLLDEGEIDIAAGETLERSFLMTVAPDARPTSVKGDFAIVWKVEVWGRVKAHPDFMHPFVIRVE